MRRPVKGQYRLPVPVYLSRRRADGSNPNKKLKQNLQGYILEQKGLQ